MAGLDSHDQVQLYWAGRTTLCAEPADFDIYDETFNWFFRRRGARPGPAPAGRRSVVRLVTADDLAPGDAVGRGAPWIAHRALAAARTDRARRRS